MRGGVLLLSVRNVAPHNPSRVPPPEGVVGEEEAEEAAEEEAEEIVGGGGESAEIDVARIQRWR